MAIKKVIEIEVKGTGEGVKSVKKLDKSLKGVKQETKEVAKETNKVGDTLDRMTGGAVSKFKGMVTAIKGVNGGFKLMKLAIIGTGIGALLLAILAVGKAFTNTEAGQNKFAKIMGVIGSVTGNLVDLLASLGEKLISVFENPKEALKNFAKLIKENIINRFNGILELIPALGSAIQKLFKGDFSGAAETAGNAVAKVVLGTENLTDSIKGASKALKEFSKEVADDAKVAADIADKRASADKIERALIVERANADREIADLRFKSEQREKFNASERIAFLQQASKISEDIASKEIAANKLRLEAQTEENKLSGTTKDDLDKIANLKAKGIQLDTAKLNLQKRLQTSLTTFQNEEKAGLKAIEDAKIKQREDDIKILEEQDAKGLAKLEKDLEAEELRVSSLRAIEEKYRIIDEENEILQLEIDEAKKLKELDDLKATEAQKQQIRDFYANKTTAVKKRQAKEEARIAVALENVKLQTLNKSSQAVIALVGKNSKLGKAVAVATAIWNTKQAITKTLATVPAPWNIPQAIATGIFGLAQVKSIISTPNPAGGGGGGSAPSAAAVSAPIVAAQPTVTPNFNVVGTSGTNQIAQSISNQNQAPIQAFVVSTDISSQQALDRQKQDTASFG